MNEKISVIVPIYKVEQVLKRCVDSILSQTYENLEIILVDDGSPDQCPAICDAYAKAGGPASKWYIRKMAALLRHGKRESGMLKANGLALWTVMTGLSRICMSGYMSR